MTLRKTTISSALCLLPLLGGCRGDISEAPPVHIVLDMDFQQKLKAQSESTFAGWSDGRGMRQPVAGTVARGGKPAGAAAAEFYIPATSDLLGTFDSNSDGGLDRLESQNSPFHRMRLFALADGNSDGSLSPAEIDAMRALWTFKSTDGSYVADNPLPATRETLERGRDRFNIHCMVCHGASGRGGIVARRWPVPVLDLVMHEDADTRTRLVGLSPGEIFETLTNGKGTMPSYAAQISVEDRWAIVHYLKALQKHFN